MYYEFSDEVLHFICWSVTKVSEEFWTISLDLKEISEDDFFDFDAFFF